MVRWPNHKDSDKLYDVWYPSLVRGKEVNKSMSTKRITMNHRKYTSNY